MTMHLVLLLNICPSFVILAFLVPGNFLFETHLFHYFLVISTGKGVWLYIWKLINNLKPLYLMLWAKFGCDWISDFAEVKKCKKFLDRMIIGRWTKAQLTSGDLFSFFSSQFKICLYWYTCIKLILYHFHAFHLFSPYTIRCLNITDFTHVQKAIKLYGFNSAEP